MESTKYFTLDEAQSLIPSVIPKLEQLAELKRELDRRGYDIQRHRYFGGMGPNGQKVFPQQMEQLVLMVQDLNEAGIEIKDVDQGLIDFPHKRKNGEIVCLCFKLGESEIVAWHTRSGGFQGRKPLSAL